MLWWNDSRGKRNTEKTNSVLEPKASSSAAAEPPEPKASSCRSRAQRQPVPLRGAEKVSVAHAQLNPGDPCPECREGKVYRQKEPATLVRIVGQAPLKATVFEMERLRCNGCGEVFTAGQPPSAGPEKFDATAVAMIALLKYGTGMPFNRHGAAGRDNWGFRLPATTQWELMEAAAKLLKAVLDELIRHGGAGRCDAQRRHRHADSAAGARRGRRTHGNLHQRHRIDLRRVENRAVLQRMEACGRKPRRCPEASRSRTGSADPDVRCVIAELAEAYRNPAGQLPGARKTAVYGSRGELSRRMPVCAGVAGRGIRLRCRSEGSRPDAGGKAGRFIRRTARR